MSDTDSRLEDLAILLSKRSYPTVDHPSPIAKVSARVIADVLSPAPWRVSYQSLMVTIDENEVALDLYDVVRAMTGLEKVEHRVSVAVIMELLNARYSPAWMKSVPSIPRDRTRVEL